jgi:pimeloyl-ACP methyl ester carboxylesterase
MKNTLTLFCCILFLSLARGKTPERVINSDSLLIDTHAIVTISDSRQYIRIKGSISDPVLLFLAGGPGDSVTGRMKQMFSKLSEEFLVVLWDIRSTGETSKQGNPEREFSQKLFLEDTEILVDHILRKYHKEKLYLAGFSWGTVPGFYMAAHHPELLHAYIAISPIIDQMKSEAMAIQLMVEEAQAETNEVALSELSEVQLPFQNAEQLYYSRKWIFLKGGNRFAKKKSFKKYVFDWSATWLEVFNEALQTNLFETLPTIKCPVYFLAGGQDIRTNPQITKMYYKQVKAPKKEFFLFENSGHLIPYEDQKRFQETLIDSILKN